MFRLFAMLSVVGLLALGNTLRAADDQPKDIIARAIKAHGGEEALMKNKASTSKGKGKMMFPGIGEVEFTQESSHMLPDKVKDSFQLTIMGQAFTVVTLINGKDFSVELDGKALDLDDKTKESAKGIIEMLKVEQLVPLLKHKEYELSLVGEDKIEDKPAIGIRVTSKSKQDINIYFDKETNLLVKSEMRTYDAIAKKEINEERIVVEYKKDKDGIPVPKKMLVKHDGEAFLELEITELQFLEKIDDSEFKK